MASIELINWLANGRRGISSNTIVERLTGIKTLDDWGGSHPLDPADLGRCRRLLDDVPELQNEFSRMRDVSPTWAALVDRWDELCATMDREAPEWRSGIGSAPETYRIMKEIREQTGG
jgi:hypothetical protein